MEKNVAIVRCKEYDQNQVDEAVSRAFDLLGGLNSVIKPGMRVAIKVNLLKKSKPEDCIVTHPSVVCAVAKQVVKLGAIATIGDSPGGLFNEATLRAIYRETGMEQAAKNSGASLNYDTTFRLIHFPQGISVKSVDVCDFIAEADAVIDCAKLKTHGLTIYTGAVKNMFGVIPGTMKAEYHFRMPESDRFCNMLVDVVECVKPVLCIIDAIIGMEGDGPGSAGTPRKVGCLIASRDAHAADLVGVTLINQPPMSIPTLKHANLRALVGQNIGDLALVGDDIQSLVVQDYVVPAARYERLRPRMAPAFLMNFVENLLTPKPMILAKACVGCGECMRNCPAKAIAIRNKLAQVDLKKCIRCFCCQELCPQKAVAIRRSRILKRFQ